MDHRYLRWPSFGFHGRAPLLICGLTACSLRLRRGVRLGDWTFVAFNIFARKTFGTAYVRIRFRIRRGK